MVDRLEEAASSDRDEIGLRESAFPEAGEPKPIHPIISITVHDTFSISLLVLK